MISDALDNGRSSRISDAQALAAPSVREECAARRAIHDGIAENDAVVRRVFSLGHGLDHDLAAAHSFSDIVVGFAREDQPHARREESAEALSGTAL